MEEFPNNSQRAKQGSPQDIDIEKIIEGDATVRKPSGWKRFRQSFIAGDASSVGEHVFWNLMLPAAQDAIADMARTFIEMMIYGYKRNRYSGPGGPPVVGFGSTSKFNYSGISSGSRQISGPGAPAMEPHQRFSPNDIIVATRAEADGIISRMFEILEEYHAVTVANLYALVGVSADYMDHKYGWTNLDSADVRRVREGVLLVLPPPQDLGR